MLEEDGVCMSRDKESSIFSGFGGRGPGSV